MSIAAQCSDCCTCPTTTVEWDSRSASKSKCGLVEFTGFISTPPKVYLKSVASGFLNGGESAAFLENAWDQVVEFNPLTCSQTTDTCTLTITQPAGVAGPPGFSGCVYDCVDAVYSGPFGPGFAGAFAGQGLQFARDSVPSSGAVCGNGLDFLGNFDSVYSIDSATSRSITGVASSGVTGVIEETRSVEYTTAALKSNTLAALPAYDGDWNDTAGSFANLSTDELTYSVRESRYRLRFKIPQTGTATCYRINWVERFIAEAGVAMSSVEVYARGCYRPTVTLSAPPSGGIQARAIAVMSSTGTVTSIRILNPGSGYTSAPTVTVQSATGGGTSSTGWTAMLTAGQVTAITGGSAGDYRPTLAFTGGGGTGATATCTLDDTGGIDAVTLGVTGSGYTSEPTLTITPKVSGSTAADLLLHLGTETAKCIAWDGTIPSGYDPATPSTYPILPGSGYYELAVPTADGTTLVNNLRAVCDGTPCT